MLCLTVYEAKGLEFDDVIVFNFFHDSLIKSSDWKLLNEASIQTWDEKILSQQILELGDKATT
jgi:DNA helicase IV